MLAILKRWWRKLCGSASVNTEMAESYEPIEEGRVSAAVHVVSSPATTNELLINDQSYIPTPVYRAGDSYKSLLEVANKGPFTSSRQYNQGSPSTGKSKCWVFSKHLTAFSIGAVGAYFYIPSNY